MIWIEKNKRQYIYCWLWTMIRHTHKTQLTVSRAATLRISNSSFFFYLKFTFEMFRTHDLLKSANMNFNWFSTPLFSLTHSFSIPFRRCFNLTYSYVRVCWVLFVCNSIYFATSHTHSLAVWEFNMCMIVWTKKSKRKKNVDVIP